MEPPFTTMKSVVMYIALLFIVNLENVRGIKFLAT